MARPTSLDTRHGAEAPPSRLVLVLVSIVALAGLLFSPVKQLVADRSTRLPVDLAPGLRVGARPYSAPDSCPLRRWAQGEFLPVACIAAHRIPAAEAPAFGLEAPAFVGKRKGRNWSGYRQREWVRASADALLVARPRGAPGEILIVVQNRFASAPAPEVTTPTDYSKPPWAYLWRTAFELFIVPIVALLVVGAIVVVTGVRSRSQLR